MTVLAFGAKNNQNSRCKREAPFNAPKIDSDNDEIYPCHNSVLAYKVISSQAQSIISNQDAAISLSGDMMQLTSGMSADVQRLVALTARGNQPISNKEAKMLTDRLSRDNLESNLEDAANFSILGSSFSSVSHTERVLNFHPPIDRQTA